MSKISSQKDNYNRIAALYHQHYGDEYSQKYRMKFIYHRLFKNFSLNGCYVLDAMGGSGESIDFFLQSGAKPVSLDISFMELKSLKSKYPTMDVVCSSITDTGVKSGQFDAVVIIGGLHHVHPFTNEAMQEIHRLLKSGGKLFLFEPHRGSIADIFRKIWYRFDKYFLENEKSIDVDNLIADFSELFEFKKPGYHGNLGYIFVFSSMILRMPMKVKKLYANFFLKLESLLSIFESRLLSIYVLIEATRK
jgi:SAM-dependent methyltransferase